MTDDSPKLKGPPVSPRTYTRSGSGLVGGMTWITKYYLPPNASAEMRAQAQAMLDQQIKLAKEAGLPGIPYDKADLQQFNFILGIAASTHAWLDLSRVLKDEFSLGELSAEEREGYQTLVGREFDRLVCHSNGAMICLAALKRQDAKAQDVVLYGPQITPDSLAAWNEMVRARAIRSLTIVVNRNDAVPPVSLQFAKMSSARGIGKALAMKGAGVETKSVFFDVDALVSEVQRLAPNARVVPGSCSASRLPGIDCHKFNAYEQAR